MALWRNNNSAGNLIACLILVAAAGGWPTWAHAQGTSLDGRELTHSAPQPLDGIFVSSPTATRFTRTSGNIIDMTSGAVLVSVRKPASMAIVATPVGSVSIGAGGGALVVVRNGLIKVQALEGADDTVAVALNQSLFPGVEQTVLPVAPGRELRARASAAGAPRPDATADGGAQQSAASPPPAYAVQPGGYVVVDSPAASLASAARLVTSMDAFMTNHQQRRYLREFAGGNVLAPYVKGMRWEKLIPESADPSWVVKTDPTPAATAPAGSRVSEPDLEEELSRPAAKPDDSAVEAAGNEATQEAMLDHLLGEDVKGQPAQAAGDLGLE